MLTNEQMIKNRFGRWAAARKRIAWIQDRLAEGRTVYVCTMTRATPYTAKHFDWFKATKSGAYVRHGKGWVCIDPCGLQAR